MVSFLNLLMLCVSAAAATSTCSTSLKPSGSVKPSVASGYEVAVIATGLAKPRSIAFDTLGNLLVVQQGDGIINLVFQDDGGTCLSVKSNRKVISNIDLNHGLALSPDGRTIYASSVDAAFSWAYDPEKASVGSSSVTIVKGMENGDHVTRTLLLSQKANNTLLVSRGSAANLDAEAESLSSGHSQIKAFDLSNVPDDGYSFGRDGYRLGWGLRNSVGLAENPDTGGIFSVENSADELKRDGKDIHQDNPGEEMNFHGFLNENAYGGQGSNYGYPLCFAAWGVDDIPRNGNLSVGSQFAAGNGNDKVDDAFCAEQTPPVLTFQAHMAPLDIEFNNSATEAWISFHGSWDRTKPVGYKLSMVPFENGNPVANPENNTAALDVLANANNSACPNNCFRPVGIAFDAHGRLFLSSDATGEIYVAMKAQALTSTNGNTTTPSSSSSTSPSPSATTSASQGVKKGINLFITICSIAFSILVSYC